MTDKPVKEFRSGNSRVAIWLNKKIDKEKKAYVIHDVKVYKSYRDNNDEWKETSYFRADELLNLQYLINKAVDYLVLGRDEE